MPKPWRFLPFDEGIVRDLSRGLQVSPVLAQVLAARGYRQSATASAFLRSKLNELHDPELLPGVSGAADRIVAAVKAGRRITVYGDYDVDGVTSVSLLWHCLRLAGGQVDYYIPHRLEEGYGLNSEALRKLHAEDPGRLVVSVDCGVASVAEAELAQGLGLELIVTDHHEFGPTLPAAHIVHPRLPGTPSPFPDLCGVGVAFKLAWAICQRLGDGRKASPAMREFLMSAVGLAAIGTIADCVPLVGENRILVRYGLTSLRERSSLGLAALMERAGLHEKPALQAEDVSFGLGPRLNAVGRMGQARLAVELLTTDNKERAAALADYVDQQNKVRQTVERKVFKQAKELVAEHPEWLDAPALVLAHPEWHAGVIGIVASRVTEHFEKPAILISLARDDGLGQGSGRTYGGCDLFAGLGLCRDLLVTFGGHRAACGVKIDAGRVDEFRTAFCERIAAQQQTSDYVSELRIDAEVLLSQLNVRAVQELEFLGPFGQGNPRPVFASARVELAEPPKKIGEGERHLAVKFRQHGTRLRGVAFGRAEWAEELAQAGTVSITYAPMINRYQGFESVELHLIDWQPSEPPASPHFAPTAIPGVRGQ